MPHLIDKDIEAQGWEGHCVKGVGVLTLPLSTVASCRQL